MGLRVRVGVGVRVGWEVGVRVGVEVGVGVGVGARVGVYGWSEAARRKAGSSMPTRRAAVRQ